MKYRKSAMARGRMSGISLVEVLVALVIISVGMLGIASLYLTSIKAGRTANLRVQGVNMVADMADRIRANKRGLAAYNSATYGGAPASHECVTVTCTPEEIAENDLNVWEASIDDALRNLGATGTVTYTAPEDTDVTHHFLVTVTWREAGEDADSSYSVIVELEKKT
jgi:type IV pilus assembly protein PilV